MNRELKTKLAGLGLACLLAMGSQAQETVGMNPGDITSPELRQDGTVTFRLQAPRASDVRLMGSFAPAEGVKMTKDASGLWTYTTAPLGGELYTYTFVVDGLRITDPNNVYMLRDIATFQNYFLVEGETSHNYFVREVPHGTAVAIEKMRERETGGIMDVDAVIYCEKESHKGIIIGKNGAMLKKIGSLAREDIEELLGCKVMLRTWVKVKENWRNSDLMLSNFGFKEN